MLDPRPAALFCGADRPAVVSVAARSYRDGRSCRSESRNSALSSFINLRHFGQFLIEPLLCTLGQLRIITPVRHRNESSACMNPVPQPTEKTDDFWMKGMYLLPRSLNSGRLDHH